MKFFYPGLSGLVLLAATGCSVTSHPDYQKTYFKQSIPQSKLDEVVRSFRKQGINGADLITDNLGRAQLSGSYENEVEFEKALGITTAQLSAEQVSRVRPKDIKKLNWEIEASKEFAKYIEGLAKKYSMAVNVQLDGVEKQISINEVGQGGVEQFSFASSEPTAKAIGFYQQMAKKVVESSGKSITQKKFLIVGHTDDVGDTEKNSVLSEQRARNVGRYFEAAGISSANIYFQGAGETFPIADNKTVSGRLENRRVEITELSSDVNLSKYLQSRQPNLDYYRYKPTQASAQKKSNIESAPRIPEATSRFQEKKPTPIVNKSPSTGLENTRIPEPNLQLPKIVSKVNFGGNPYTTELATLDVGGLKQSKSLFSFISTARAESVAALGDCTADRPRIAGEVKSLQTNGALAYKTTEFAPRLYGKTWAGEVNSNLVILNRVYVLRENGESPTAPQFNIYANYKDKDGTQKPDLSPATSVNSYLVGKGILYRVFPNQASGVSCIDVLFPMDGSTEAKAGRIVYSADKSLYVASYKPQMQN
jgi:outer membrane protein OmpA-like peptidoglycan-associated protein